MIQWHGSKPSAFFITITTSGPCWSPCSAADGMEPFVSAFVFLIFFLFILGQTIRCSPSRRPSIGRYLMSSHPHTAFYNFTFCRRMFLPGLAWWWRGSGGWYRLMLYRWQFCGGIEFDRDLGFGWEAGRCAKIVEEGQWRQWTEIGFLFLWFCEGREQIDRFSVVLFGASLCPIHPTISLFILTASSSPLAQHNSRTCSVHANVLACCTLFLFDLLLVFVRFCLAFLCVYVLCLISLLISNVWFASVWAFWFLILF